MNTKTFVALSFASTLAAACGGAAPPPAAPQASEPSAPAAPSGPKLAMEQELGSIDPGDVEKAFAKIQPSLSSCHKAALKRIDFVAGDVKLFVRLDRQGKVRYAYFEESSLGDFAFEQCLLKALATAPWPVPDGGEAEIRKGFGFDPADGRPPTAWGPEKVLPAIEESKDVAKCKEGIEGQFVATLYVQPDGKAGKVESAGLAVPSVEGAARAQCIVDALKELSLPSPGSWVAKTTVAF